MHTCMSVRKNFLMRSPVLQLSLLQLYSQIITTTTRPRKEHPRVPIFITAHQSLLRRSATQLVRCLARGWCVETHADAGGVGSCRQPRGRKQAPHRSLRSSSATATRIHSARVVPAPIVYHTRLVGQPCCRTFLARRHTPWCLKGSTAGRLCLMIPLGAMRCFLARA